jgi:hypothetical protein
MSARSLETVGAFEVGLRLPDVKECAYYGARALKLNGQMVVCTPVNKSAEPNSIAVAMGFERRAALLKNSPSVYYVTDHYAPHPIVLIRLSRISRVALEQTLRLAWEFAASEGSRRRSSGKAKRGARRPPSGRFKARAG